MTLKELLNEGQTSVYGMIYVDKENDSMFDGFFNIEIYKSKRDYEKKLLQHFNRHVYSDTTADIEPFKKVSEIEKHDEYYEFSMTILHRVL